MNYVTYEEKKNIAIITISRPKALNALNTRVLEELEKVVDSIDKDRIRCVILTGAGERAFVAGADIEEMSNLSVEEAKGFAKKGNRVFRKMEITPIPFIAAVNGFALGGGCELAMSCDIRICSEKAVFGQPEVGLGITPGFGGTQRLARLIGISKAKEILYTARNVRADEAYRIGLVNGVYPVEELMTTAWNMANTIAKNAPRAVQNCKIAVNLGGEKSMEEALELENQLFGNCFSTQDQKEGMKAFLEKRKEKVFLNR